MADFDITGVNQFGGARLPEQLVPVGQQPQQMQMIPQQGAILPPQQVVPQSVGIDPAVAAKLFAPVEENPYGY